MSFSRTATVRQWPLRGTPGRAAGCARSLCFLVVAVFLLVTAEPLAAQTRDELRAAMQRLRQVERSLGPLPSSTIGRDVGQIAIVEHDGSNYDARKPDDTLNYEARIRVGLRFYETHADAYDFLVVFTNFPFKTGDATAFHLFGRNDVQGIGKPVDSVQDVFGSPSRLKGWIDMADVSQYRQRPFSVTHGERGFQQTLNVLAHEVGHQWLAEATYKRDGASRKDLLGADGVHWSYLLDSDASLLYGADWRDTGGGTYTAARAKEAYSALDLYLMGFLPKEKVPPVLLLQNPAIDPRRINKEGEVVTATGTTVVTVDELVDDMGPRRPDSVHSQKEFRLGFVFLTRPGTEPSEDDLAAVEQVRRAFGAHFFALTHGVAWADTTLVETPTPPRAAVPDLQKALTWLAAQQAIDGSWADSAETCLRDTAAAVRALATAGAASPAWQRGIGWLRLAQPESLDFRARLASALGPAGVAAADSAARIDRILSAQNADGGFGAGADFASDALDTALALRALRALQHPEDARVRAAVGALSALANPDGGWSAVVGGETSTVATVEVLLAVLDWRETPGASALEVAGLGALGARQNPDGGFGSSPSTAHATALATEVLLRAGDPGGTAAAATAWLQANQLTNGSWADSPYQTAVVLSALRQSVGPNLVVPESTLALQPNPVEEGETVQVTARVRNSGRAAAGATVARLYDGDPASSPPSGEASVPPLAPGEEAEVTFAYSTQDRAGTRTLYVVADATDAVVESREDDNTASRPLTVAGKLPDLAVGPGDILVVPAGPEVGESATVTVTVHNAGERPAAASALLVSVTDTSGATVHLPLAGVPALAPGGAASTSVPWSPAVAGPHVLRATADARYEVPESDETNDAADRMVIVVEKAPDGPDLAVTSAALVPDTLSQLPQEIEVRAVVENLGRSPATSTLAVFDGEVSGTRLGTATVAFDARSAAPITLRVTVTTPGPRTLFVVADADDQVPEVDEANNVRAVPLRDARTLDLELVPGSVALSSATVESGDTATVTFVVRNRGTLDVPLVPVQLANAATGRELARVDIGVAAGQTRAASLAWRTEAPGEIPLSVRVDPFDLLAETREDNNTAALTLSVRPSGLPNLSVGGADVTFAPDPPVEGGTAVVSALVRNAGVVPVGPFAVRFYVGDPDAGGTLIGESPVGGLGPESSETVSVTWSPVNARGSLGAFVLVDPLDQVEESDESDNRAFRPFQATGLADLVLAAADVALEPGYPRVGEEVTIRATVRNLGGQPSAATSVKVVEGRSAAGAVVGVLALPELPPGGFSTLSLPWTPSSPPGERTLRLEVDPDGLVLEQDEGNNESSRTVVVQDADLYLTEPYFSPNGDGVKDETTLAWRASGPVSVVVSNARGQLVRTLVTDGPASGSATWDGRDERGVVAWDGRYTVTVTGEDSRVLGRTQVDLDTDRSPIQDAYGPATTSIRNLTCSLPPSLLGPAWMPGEDEVLFIVPSEGVLQPGLLRVGLDGGSSYVVQDDWYRQASFAGAAPVSPDGREVLVTSWQGDGRMLAVDLATGARRTVGAVAGAASWSPDGRFILSGNTVLQRDGSVVVDLCDGWNCSSEWAWSPTSDRLAGGTRGDRGAAAQLAIVARDGIARESIPLPWDERPFQYAYVRDVAWRGDGNIVARVDIVIQEDRESASAVYVVDPGTRAVKRLPVDGSWSPDGSRVLDDDGNLWLEDGTAVGFLSRGVTVSPGSSAASYVKRAGDDRPGSVCGDKSEDVFVVSTLANLTAQLQLTRLPGSAGLLVSGTAADRNLDRFQLDYASRDDPATWHPIGAASDAPVADDVFTVWVPPAPGTYLLRLSVSDRAGNARVATRVVDADRLPALANFTQSEYFLSPNGDGVKDEVAFRYLVVEPTRLDVRIVGPEPTGAAAPPAREVRRLALEYPQMGPQSFTWNGTDAAGQVVPDGRYTVYLNGLPFRVEVDDTPPDIALRFDRLHFAPWQDGAPCPNLSTLAADRAWHVVDPHLKGWTLEDGIGQPATGTDEVFVVETDAAGLPILDEGGRPRMRRVEGKPADRVDEETALAYRASAAGFRFAAEDHAGNRSEVSVPPVPEGVFALGATYQCTTLLAAPVAGENEPGPDGKPVVHRLVPAHVDLFAAASLNRGAQNARFSFQPRQGGAWVDVPVPKRRTTGEWHLPVESFEALGADPIQTYRGRFVGAGGSGEVASDPFLFSPCTESMDVRFESTGDGVTWLLVLRAQTTEPVEEAWANLTYPDGTSERRTLIPTRVPSPFGGEEDAFVTPILLDCAWAPDYEVDATTVTGRRVRQGLQRSCLKESGGPVSCSGGWLRVEQRFTYCEGSPDQLHLQVQGPGVAGSRVDLDHIDQDGSAAPLASFVVTRDMVGARGSTFVTKIVADVTGVPQGSLAVRGRLYLAGAGPDDPPVETTVTTVVDRTPVEADLLLPPEGGLVCASPASGDAIAFRAIGLDASPRMAVEARARAVGGAWSALVPTCGEVPCPPDRTVPTGVPVDISWNASKLEAGDYQAETTFCDRSGNTTRLLRTFTLTRQPKPRVISVSRPLFSPNGDGRAEETVVTVRLGQAGLLTARVRRGDEKGPVVRTLVVDQPQTATDVAVVWDGRADDGQRAPDGVYAVVLTVADACGGQGETSARVEVDTAPPEVEITEPAGGQRVSASVDVLGKATDPNFSTWELDVACGGSAEWTRLAARGYPVAPGSLLARWDTSRAPPGECRLRLVAEDQAENRSPEVFAAATVERGELLEALSATPDVFSPNGDGRRETTTVGYGLLRPARVRLEARDSGGRVLRTFESGAEHGAGSWSHVWDGLDDSGKPAAEGTHILWVRAEDPEAATVYEEKTVRLDLDRTPPAVEVSRPMPDGFVSPAATVRGSVTDRNLALFTVSVAPAGGAAVELARGSQGFSDERDLAPLSSLAEGPHVLRVVASDAAENETRIERPFVVDATPPVAAIHVPAAGAVVRRGEAPIAVTGLVGDDHLESWTSRFGAGSAPAVLTAIGHGETGGEGLALGAWDVRFVPDGVYTISLLASDRAGLSTEARVAITLDGTPPTVALTSPVGGGYVKAPGPVEGTATDANLASWELETAPGDAAAADRWSPLASGTRAVAGDTLAEWWPLPPDGVYTLKLTARDAVGLSASTKATVTVDTTPPATPTGLKAVVTKASEGHGHVVLTWNANTEPDLAGYRIEPPGATWSADLLRSPASDDGERLEGRYTYRVLAEDKAGNQSPPATLQVLVDLTPPLVSFSFPAEGESVAGAIDVRGTAWSADDFAEYRLLVRSEAKPTEWTPLRRSSVAVAGGRLGEWLALADGPYVLALEAEDTNGNEARVTRHVIVDTAPPAPPVLVAVAKGGPLADWLVPTWEPSPSDGVIGTLVYRNGRLANATSVVLGDRRAFVVPGTSYKDEKLPDGEHCYRVSAVDAAGNESALSGERCESLDNRAPRAVIVSPLDGTRFGFPVRVVAETPDLDVASVRFERRASGSADWVGFDLRTSPPWETTLDPDPPGGTPLVAGPYELRAVATDRTGNTDPDPARITVVYGDTTPPPAPTGLVARVDGRDVTLTWSPVQASDLATYSVYRDGERIAAGLTEPRHVDAGLSLGTYEYAVTALDTDANEGPPSDPADAVVYAVRLEPPAWPVVSSAFGSVEGSGSRPGTVVKVLRADEPVAERPAAGGAFRVDVPLVPDGNALQARGEDAAGNRSVPSDEVVLISNAAPAAVGGLEAQVDAGRVSLQWAPGADADLVGYVVRRDGERLTGSSPQKEAASIEATRAYGAAWAFDGDPTTAWVPEWPGTGTWTVTFPAPVLVDRVRLRFGTLEGSNPGIAADCTLLARWQGRDIPVARVRGNTGLDTTLVLPAPFLTTALSVRLDSAGSLAEVAVEKLDVVPAGTESYQDESVPDGRHTYEVAAIDRYGAEGAPGTVEAAVGDVDPPGRPTGLVATPIVRDVQLTWNASPDLGVAHYVVLRDAARIGTSLVPSYLDSARPNGTWRYTVIAVDEAGNESEPSDPADATIDVQPTPPAAPVILEPTDAAHPVTLAASRTDVAGRAVPGASVALEVDGQPRGSAPAGPGFRLARRIALPVSDVALSPDGRWAAWCEAAGVVSVQDLATGAIRLVPHGGAGWAERLAFSPDGTALALTRLPAGSPYENEVAVLRLADGAVSLPMSGSWVPDGYAWSPDGARLAVSLREPGGGSLHVVDVATGGVAERARSSGVDTHLRWSPDGGRLAFVRNWGGGVATELQVLDLASSRTRVVDPQPWPDAPPSWSADGRRLAWTTAGEPLRVRVQDVDQAQASTDVAEAGSDVVDPRFSPDGDWLSFVGLRLLDTGTTLRSVHAIQQAQGLRVTVSEPREGSGPPDVHDWLGGRLAIRAGGQLDLYAPEAGRFVVRDVPLVPGENRLVARATDPATGLESPDSETVLVTVPADAFPDLVVVPEGILSVPPVPVASRPAQLRVRVENRGAVDSGETEVLVRVTDPGGALVVDSRATLAAVVSGREAWVVVPWTPAAPGGYTAVVQADPDGRVAEASESNNTAERVVTVVAQEGLATEIASDRASYPALSTAHVTVRVTNAGTPFTGVALTTAEDAAGSAVAVLDERAVSLEWGKTVAYAVDWSTGTTPAGPYTFRVRVRPAGATEPAASAERAFTIEPGLSVRARVRLQPLTVAEGTPASFLLGVDNRSTNVALAGATARLRVRPEGSNAPATFETLRALPSLSTAASWEATDVWPAAQPAGRYTVLFEVTKGDVVLASASALLTVAPVAAVIRGTVTVEPGEVLAGASAQAHVHLENGGTATVSGYPLAVELVSGPEATVHLSVPATVDLAVGETRSLTVSIATTGVAPGPYVVRLRGGASPVTLDRSRLVVHGLISPPSPHAPAEGARVDTPHPALVVNDASSPEGAALTYEYALFGDAQLTQPLPGAAGVAQTPSRTSWTVAAGLAEDATYWWRARATDGFSTSAWSAVASFTVDAVNRPPTAPVPDTPLPGARVASRQPALTVRNAVDPELQPLTYEFRLATDEAMTQVLASEAGVAEGLGLTAWTVTALLDEDEIYYWTARAKTAGEAPEDFSPWSVPVAFRVHTVNGSPTAPTPLRPTGGVEVTTHTPALVVANATDPESDPLTYRFEVDVQPEFGSPERQASPELGPGTAETEWTPPLALRENTLHYWRAHASDGNTTTSSVLASFFVNAANEAPGAPVALDPVDGRTVGTATPTLRLRNAVDPESDPLTYEVEVRDASGAVVARAAGVPSGAEETAWTVTTPLAEDQAFTWSARASDGALEGEWSKPASFRVDAVVEPPTAPVPRLPADGAVVDERRPSLVVENATSPDGLKLTYTFELDDDAGTPVESAEGVPETPDTTAWTPSRDLADGAYQWRARASDPVQAGPWSPTWRFGVLVDEPPGPPTGLEAVAGDARVRLDWSKNPEHDVTGYRVYRSTTAGGGYAFVHAVVTNGYDDLGLTNGVTYYYVVTALDARSESDLSNEASARPEAPQALVAEVRYAPAAVRGECLLPASGGHQHHATVLADRQPWFRPAGRVAVPGEEADGGFDTSCHPSDCPDWLLATLELPAGHDPGTIDVASLRLFGSVPADAAYSRIVDADRDGLAERQVRFRFEDVAPHLAVGGNAARIVGQAGGSEVAGTGTIEVLPLATDLRVTPRTLQRRSCGEDVQARITFAAGVPASKVSVSSIRLNGVVPVKRVVPAKGQDLVVTFDRRAVVGVLRPGSSVEVRVTGTLQGLPFVGVDHIRVIE